MTRYAAFLRGVNVGGQKSIKMAELRGLCLAGGLAEVETYIQSGNIVFSAGTGDGARLAGRIAGLILGAWGFEVVVIVKAADELARIVESNPLAREGGHDAKALYATLLERAPQAGDAAALASPGRESERFEIVGDVVYTCYAQGYGKSDFSNNYIERALKVAATTRNWTTMLKVSAMTKSRMP